MIDIVCRLLIFVTILLISGIVVVFGIPDSIKNIDQVCCEVLRVVDGKERTLLTQFTSGECVKHGLDAFIGQLFITQFGKRLPCLVKQSYQLLSFFIWLSFVAIDMTSP